MKKLLLVLILLLVPIMAGASVFQDSSYFPYEDQANQQGNSGFFTDDANYSKSCIADGSCSLDQGFNTFVVLTKWGLGILGSVSLLFFIMGGFIWLTSGGIPDKIAKGRSIMVNTVIGIIIVLSAWMIVQTILTSISDRTLQGLDGDSQLTDSCTTTNAEGNPVVLDNGTSCRGNLGVCQSGVCTAKCNAASTQPAGPNYDCRPYDQCEESSIVRMYCFGANNIVCCQPETP